MRNRMVCGGARGHLFVKETRVLRVILCLLGWSRLNGTVASCARTCTSSLNNHAAILTAQWVVRSRVAVSPRGRGELMQNLSALIEVEQWTLMALKLAHSLLRILL